MDSAVGPSYGISGQPMHFSIRPMAGAPGSGSCPAWVSEHVIYQGAIQMKTSLLLIDIQNDYFPGGKMELVDPLEASKKANELLQCFREHGLHHVHIQHVATKPDATFLRPDGHGADIHDSVAHFVGEPLVIKHFPNAFRETNLLELLRAEGTERVIITGMMTHMCVDATV